MSTAAAASLSKAAATEEMYDEFMSASRFQMLVQIHTKNSAGYKYIV